MQKITSTVLSLILILIGTIVLFLCLFVLPEAAQEIAQIHPEVSYLKYPILIGMYATAVPFFYAIVETLKIIYIIERQSIYSERIVQALTSIKYCGCIIIGLYMLGIFVLDFTNALPPVIAAMGFGILLVTILIVTGAAFIKNVLLKINSHYVINATAI